MTISLLIYIYWKPTMSWAHWQLASFWRQCSSFGRVWFPLSIENKANMLLADECLADSSNPVVVNTAAFAATHLCWLPVMHCICPYENVDMSHGSSNPGFREASMLLVSLAVSWRHIYSRFMSSALIPVGRSVNNSRIRKCSGLFYHLSQFVEHGFPGDSSLPNTDCVIFRLHIIQTME